VFSGRSLQLVQGGAEEGQAICLDPRVRAVCFTGSVPVGPSAGQGARRRFRQGPRARTRGRNAAIICGDADLEIAAQAVADGMCLTCGQRCNATSRILVDEKAADAFAERLLPAVAAYRPGDPLKDSTKLGPLISEAAVERFEQLADERATGCFAALHHERPTANAATSSPRQSGAAPRVSMRNASCRWSISRHSPTSTKQ
jgi:acyl-CoA reductase-like NAD-dependent aldehyde dehydrogenase